MDQFGSITESVKNAVSSDVFVVFILLVCLFFSVRMLFPQFRFLRQAFASLADKSGSTEGISPIKTLNTTLGDRIGVGNVAGIATAIATGGPGALAWLWIFGIFGSCLAMVEAILSQAYKVRIGDEYFGGPAYYIERGLGNRLLANIFAVIAILSMCVLLPGIQTNTAVNNIVYSFGADRDIAIIVAALVVAYIIWGGIKRIGAVENILTPLKCGLYILLGLVVFVTHFDQIGTVFGTVVSAAFGSPESAFHSIVGSAVGMGVRRGIFSTDVGNGNGGMIAAAARCEHPVKQGLLQGLSILFSTLVICTISGFIILLCDTYQVVDPSTGAIIYTGSAFLGGEAGAEWVQQGLNTTPLLAGWASQALALIIIVLASGCIIGYYYLIETNLRYLLKEVKSEATVKRAFFALKVLFLCVMVGCTLIDISPIWNTADIAMGLMSWINLVVLLVLSPQVIQIMKDYEKQKKAGVEPVFDPAVYGIDDPTGAWRAREENEK